MLPIEIFTLIKDEALYLDEWIQFHFAQGVRHIHLFDNDSSDNPKSITSKYRNVTVKPQSGHAQQFVLYPNIIKEKRDPCWGAFIDADEFLYCPMGWSLPEILQPYESFGAVGVCWVVYGPNGQTNYNLAPVRDRFKKGRLDCHIKSVIRLPGKELGPTWNPHCFNLVGGTVDELLRPIEPLNPWMSDPSATRLRIDHYSFKSLEEHKIKCERGYFGACGYGKLNEAKRLTQEEKRIQEWLTSNKQISYKGDT